MCLNCDDVEVENINLIQDSDYVTIEHTNLFPNHVQFYFEYLIVFNRLMLYKLCRLSAVAICFYLAAVNFKTKVENVSRI